MPCLMGQEYIAQAGQLLVGFEPAEARSSKRPQPLSALKIADATVGATRSALQDQIVELRRREISWDAIGNALGISRQAAWERFS